MAQAKVYSPAFDIFNPPKVGVGTWTEEFPVFYHGADVPGGIMTDNVPVTFLDSDGALAMDQKIKAAIIAKGTERGITVPTLLGVVSFAPPRWL